MSEILTPLSARPQGAEQEGGLGRDCYVWLFASASCDEHPCYVFEYGPGRGSDVPVRFLGPGWDGTVVTDAYDGYDELVRLGARRMSTGSRTWTSRRMSPWTPSR